MALHRDEDRPRRPVILPEPKQPSLGQQFAKAKARPILGLPKDPGPVLRPVGGLRSPRRPPLLDRPFTTAPVGAAPTQVAGPPVDVLGNVTVRRRPLGSAPFTDKEIKKGFRKV